MRSGRRRNLRRPPPPSLWRRRGRRGNAQADIRNLCPFFLLLLFPRSCQRFFFQSLRKGLLHVCDIFLVVLLPQPLHGIGVIECEELQVLINQQLVPRNPRAKISTHKRSSILPQVLLHFSQVFRLNFLSFLFVFHAQKTQMRINQALVIGEPWVEPQTLKETKCVEAVHRRGRKREGKFPHSCASKSAGGRN
ncbi:MAG: hypothetical protein [Siphoviridae sp. ctpQM7]|nr:MAG: hypothetical protein [Siphoviridae sp. ctpQM7]